MDWQMNVPMFTMKDMFLVEAVCTVGGIMIGIGMHMAYMIRKSPSIQS